MEDQTISTPNQTRTAVRLSTPAIRDNKKKSQLAAKKTLSKIVDIIPQHSNEYPSIIQTPLGSNISSLTKEKPFKKKNNKVENFLHKWKHSRNKKTKLNNTLNKKYI